MSELKRYIQFRPVEESSWCTVDSADLMLDMVGGADDETYEFRFVTLTPEAYEALGEFDGW